MLAVIHFFNICIARSTAPVPVCSLQFLVLQNSLYTLQINALPLPDFVLSGTPYRLIKFFRNLKIPPPRLISIPEQWAIYYIDQFQ